MRLFYQFPWINLARPVQVLALLVLAMAGCESRPRAPALSDAPIYNNRQEGFRFLVPDGWTQSATAALPTGKLESEVLLVQYRMKTAQQGATLDVLVFDEDQPSDLKEYHQLPSQAVDDWTLTQPEEDLTVNGVKAQRLIYSGNLGEQRMIKEVVAFRRGQRVYSFIGLFWNNDAKAREQLRRAVDSIIWS